MEELARAEAWIMSGTEFEIGLESKIKALFPHLKVIDGTEGVRFRSLGAHDHDHIDRHFWLGCQGAEIMAFQIRNTLCAIDPGNAPYYSENYETFIQEIRSEFNKLKIELEALRGKTVMVYHPAFGYFFDEFGIIQEAVETDGKEPSPRILAQLIEKAKMDKPSAVFIQAQFPAESGRTVAQAFGAELVIFDPLAYDWLVNIREMGEALKRAAP
jgi:zinc transport system substrate-binding protein